MSSFVWFFFFFHPCTLHFFVCSTLITGLVGLRVVGCFSWPHCFDVRGRHAQCGVTEGKYKTPLFSVHSSVFFCRGFSFGFVKKTVQFFFGFVGLMKNNPCKYHKVKNVYFYDFWVITLSFANKIFNDNLTGCMVSWFRLCLALMWICEHIITARSPVFVQRDNVRAWMLRVNC